jgi:hypothetical protein
LALRTPVAGFNGGILVKPDMTILEQHVLTGNVARCALEVVLGSGMDAWVYSGKDWLVRNADAPHVAREEWTVRSDRCHKLQFHARQRREDRRRERRS